MAHNNDTAGKLCACICALYHEDHDAQDHDTGPSCVHLRKMKLQEENRLAQNWLNSVYLTVQNTTKAEINQSKPTKSSTLKLNKKIQAGFISLLDARSNSSILLRIRWYTERPLSLH